MDTSEQRNRVIKENRDSRNEALNITHKNYQNDEDAENYGNNILNGYDPNKAIPDQEHIMTDEEDLSDDFHSPADLDDEDQEDLNDEFDNPSDANINDDFNEVEDLEDIDEDDDEDLEDDLEEGEIEEEDSGDNYPDNDPRKF